MRGGVGIPREREQWDDWSHGICRDERKGRSRTKDIEATSEVGGPAALPPQQGWRGTPDPRGSTQV